MFHVASTVDCRDAGRAVGSIYCVASILPLRTAILIGADEGFEVAKATLSLNGYKVYTDVWNDQPPLHTFLVTETLWHFSSTMLARASSPAASPYCCWPRFFVLVGFLMAAALRRLQRSCYFPLPGFCSSHRPACWRFRPWPRRWRLCACLHQQSGHVASGGDRGGHLSGIALEFSLSALSCCRWRRS